MGLVKRIVRWIGKTISAIGQWIESALEDTEDTDEQRDFAVEPYKPAKDSLGREKFTRHIANYIKNWDEGESLVVAIYGGWGEGKTFLKDRVLEEIYGQERLQDPGEAIPVVQYNPWRWSGQDELYEGFFQTLEDRFRDLGEKGGRSASEWKRLADDANAAAASRGFPLSATGELGAILRTLLAVVAFWGIPQIPDTFSGIPFLLPREWLPDSVVGRLVIDPPCSLVEIKWVLGLAMSVIVIYWLKKFRDYKYFTAKADQAQRGLGEVRDSIQKTLRELNERGESILIVIDDIDRLTAKQIRMTMQLVKANAGFVGVKYLLLFERQLVEKSLDDNADNGIKGRDFLQKIIRRGFDLPSMPTSKLLDHFYDRLQKGLGSQLAARVRGILTGAGFRQLLTDYILNYLNTIRDVDRLLGTLPLHLKLYDSGGDRLDVHVSDLFCIEVLRVFEPDLFRKIQQFDNELTVSEDHFPGSEGRHKTRLKEVQKSLLETVDPDDRPAAKGLLHELFPLLEWSDRAPESSGWSHPVQEWRAQNRVAHPRNFNRYFERALSEDDVSQGVIDNLLYADADSDQKIIETWRTLCARAQGAGVVDALYKLLDRTDEIGNHEVFLHSLFEVANDFPSKVSKSFRLGPRRLAVGLVRRVLEQEIDSRDAREELLNRTLKSTSSVLFSCQVVEEIMDIEEGRRGDSGFAQTYSDDGIEKAKGHCVAKIESDASDDLLSNENLFYLLVRWSRWKNEQEPKKWLKQVLSQDPPPVFKVLRGFLRPAEAEERKYIFRNLDLYSPHTIDVEWMDKLGVLERMQELMSSEDEDKFEEEEERLANLFDAATHRYFTSEMRPGS